VTKKLSFEEFVQKNERPRCVMCVLPERQEIDKVYRDGKASKQQVAEYLHRVIGYHDKTTFGEDNKVIGISRTAVEKHYTDKHHFDV
jgi:hypothetical protein